MGGIEAKITEEIRRNLIMAIAIMDDKGRMNPEANSQMLWLKDWDQVRDCLVKSVGWCDELSNRGKD